MVSSVATLLCLGEAELRARYRVFADLVTFGAPRIGNDRYVATLMAQSPAFGQNIRIVHVDDPIPSIPWASLGWRHPGPEYVITSDTGAPVTPDSIVIKRLDDALAENDPILGIILGAYTNHSAESESITRPHVGAQRAIFSKILSESAVDPNTVSYIEMHGT